MANSPPRSSRACRNRRSRRTAFVAIRFSLQSRRFDETRPYSDQTSGPALGVGCGTVAGRWRTSDGIFQTEDAERQRQLLHGAKWILHAHQCYRGPLLAAMDNVESTGTLLL